MSEYVIELNHVEKRFDGFHLGPVTLRVPRGSIVGYIGENGAGKSTTIKLILGLIRPDGGEISCLGNDPCGAETRYRDLIGVVFDDLFLPDDMKVREAEHFCGLIYPSWDREVFLGYERRFRLPAEKKVKTLSRGMRMKLSIAIVLSHHAELLLLDEATSGLDPMARDEILDILMEFMEDETHTILISSHILSDLEKGADYIAFIHQGKLLFMEEKDVLKEEYAICALSAEQAEAIPEEAVLGRRSHAFGQELLVRRNAMPADVEMHRPSIEEIMIYLIKGGADESTHL